MMFSLNKSPKNMGDCSCEYLRYGNIPRIKTTFSAGFAAAIMGWDGYCEIKDYDEIAKIEAEKE